MTIEEIKQMLTDKTELDSEFINVKQGKKVVRAKLSGVTLNTDTRKGELTYTLPEVERTPRQAKPEVKSAKK